MTYYVIQGFSKEIDNEHKTHLYPSYLTSYNLSFGGKNFGFQSGLRDALKFTTEELATKWKNKGEEVFGDRKELDIIPIDSRLLGRVDLLYIIDK